MPIGIYKRPKGWTNSGSFKKGIIFTEEFKQKIRDGMKRGKESEHWLGDQVKYHGLHDWVYRELGAPTTCIHCLNNILKGHQIHWANISGEYKRDVKDWWRLCVKCHSKYDTAKNIIKEFQKHNALEISSTRTLG